MVADVESCIHLAVSLMNEYAGGLKGSHLKRSDVPDDIMHVHMTIHKLGSAFNQGNMNAQSLVHALANPFTGLAKTAKGVETSPFGPPWQDLLRDKLISIWESAIDRALRGVRSAFRPNSETFLTQKNSENALGKR